MTDAIRERVARAICKSDGFKPDRLLFGHTPRWQMELGRVDAALAAVRAVLLEEVAAPLWTVADHDTYAVMHRPDGSAAARFHVIAEAHEAARAMNALAVWNAAQRFGGAKK